jgi:hypothetical protein
LQRTDTRVARLQKWTATVCGRSAVPIYESLERQGVFAPDEVSMLGKVFEDVLQTLGLVDRQDPLTDRAAKCLVEYAKAGIRDPERLKAITIQALTQQQQQQIQARSARRAL